MSLKTQQNRFQKNTVTTHNSNDYRVILLNDDITTMDFVVNILMTIFQKSQRDALTIMMKVHVQGRAICGIYPFSVAENKVFLVTQLSQKNHFPLRCIMEEN